MSATIADMRALIEDEIETIERIPARRFDGAEMIEREPVTIARLQSLKHMLVLLDLVASDPELLARYGRRLAKGAA